MGKVWVLDTDTKGTGAQMVPLEKTLAEPAPKGVRRKRAASANPPAAKRPVADRSGAARRSAPKRPAETTSTPLPPGHVRKKATGEIGRVQSIDARAGTATVLWLRGGAVSTVPLTAVSRR